MKDFDVGDRVRVDIPDETRSDHDQYHGRHGEIIAFIPEVSDESSDDESSRRVRVDFDDGSYADFRIRDLRPPITE